MPAPRPLRRYFEGVLAGIPFVIVVGPFGLIFGVVATEAGLDLAQTMSMSFIVAAGAAQFAAVQMLADNASVFAVLAAGLAVNMRMAMYSAAMVPHLGRAPLWQRIFAAYFLVDQSYGVAIRRFEEGSGLGRGERMAYFIGSASPVCPIWYLGTYVGAVGGEAIPEDWALDFAVPITFLALIAPYLRSLPHLAAAFVSIVLALGLAGLPPGGGVLLAGIAGMITGAVVELVLERRK